MQTKITPEYLNNVAIKASLKKYDSIIAKLEKSARRGKNGIVINYIPEVLVSRLKKEGYYVTTYVRRRSSFFFKRKMIRYYVVKFKKIR